MCVCDVHACICTDSCTTTHYMLAVHRVLNNCWPLAFFLDKSDQNKRAFIGLFAQSNNEAQNVAMHVYM